MDFITLCNPHRNELLSLAKRFTGQEATAEDLIQETYLRAYRHWNNFHQETDNPNRDVRAWLKRILTNTFYTEWQRDQKRNQMHEDFATEFDEAAEHADPDISSQVHRMLDKLRPMYREVLDLHYLQDKSYQEIADILNIKFVQVQKRLYRARQYIKTFYEQAGISPARVNSTPLKTAEPVKTESDSIDGVVAGDNAEALSA